MYYCRKKDSVVANGSVANDVSAAKTKPPTGKGKAAAAPAAPPAGDVAPVITGTLQDTVSYKIIEPLQHVFRLQECAF